MPAYKVPCPRCGQFIMRDVAVCPFCQAKDPFSPIRCAACNTVIADVRWTACPSCGTPVPGRTQPAGAPAPAQPAGAAGAVGGAPVNPWLANPPAATAPAAQPVPAAQPAPAPAPAPPAAAAPASQQFCTGCGSALTAGARFCNVCGTLAS